MNLTTRLIFAQKLLDEEFITLEQMTQLLNLPDITANATSVVFCAHSWVDTGMRKSWCRHCNEDKP